MFITCRETDEAAFATSFAKYNDFFSTFQVKTVAAQLLATTENLQASRQSVSEFVKEVSKLNQRLADLESAFSDKEQLCNVSL